MTRNPATQQPLQRIPKKWATAIVVALIVYALVQPFVKSSFGLRLPSLPGILGMEKPVANSPETVSPETVSPETVSPETVSPETASNTSTTTEPKQTKPDASGDLLYGLLKEIGRDVYVSPAGLCYTRGSEEGHRLKHLEKHLKDIPDRPGKHGVFDGDMAQTLQWIDDAYTRGKQGAKGVRKRDENGRTLYEVPFTKTIGFIGGRDGKRDNNPIAKRLRLVVEGDKVITAFPY